jgi:enterochelin esterase-like enzyme
MHRAAAAIIATMLSACASIAGQEGKECCNVAIIADVPENSGDVYLAGSLDALGPWRADGLKMEGEGRERRATLTIPPGTQFEYKFTQGDWSREGTGPSGTVMANFRLDVTGDATERREVVDWKKDPEVYVNDIAGAGVIGDLVYWENVTSKFLERPRRVSVWTPPGYAENPKKRYKVLYMSDGQNLFDPRIANTGVDWGVDEAIASLAAEGAIDPPIVVATWSTDQRGPEYSPWGGAPQYARFLIEELAPRVNREFRTLTGPENTYHMGSSMGGLLSMHLATRRPDFIGGCGCISTHLPLSPKMVAEYFPGAPQDGKDDPVPYFEKDIAAGWPIPKTGRYWFDYGTRTLDADYDVHHQKLRAHLIAQGLVEGEHFMMTKYEGALHNETSWRARLKDSLLWLYGK